MLLSPIAYPCNQTDVTGDMQVVCLCLKEKVSVCWGQDRPTNSDYIMDYT